MKKILLSIMLALTFIMIINSNQTYAYEIDTFTLPNDSWTKTETYTGYYSFSYGEVLPTQEYDSIDFVFGGETGINYQFTNIDGILDDGTDDSRITLIRSGKSNITFLLSSYFKYYGLSLDYINEDELNDPVIVSIDKTDDFFVEFLGYPDSVFDEITAISIVLYTDLQPSWFSEKEWRFQEALKNLKVEIKAPRLKINYYKGFERIQSSTYFLDEDFDLLTLSDSIDYEFIGWRNNGGIPVTKNNIESFVNDNGEINLYSRYRTSSGVTIDSPTSDNTPEWLQTTLSKIGLNTQFGYFILILSIMIVTVIILASLHANYFIYVIILGLELVFFNVFGLIPFYALFIMISALVMTIIFMIRGGADIE